MKWWYMLVGGFSLGLWLGATLGGDFVAQECADRIDATVLEVNTWIDRALAAERKARNCTPLPEPR